MRVVLATGIYPPDIGGPATFVPALAADWVKRGHQVTIVTYGDEKTLRSKDWLVEVVSRTGGTLLRYLRYAWSVYRHARSADVVFLQGPFSDGMPGTIGAWLARRPTILRVPGDFAWEGMQRASANASQSLEVFLNQPKPFPWGLVFTLERWVARRAKAVLTPSAYLQQLADAWGVPKERQRVIYNTVELASVASTRSELRERFALAPHAKVLLYFGRLTPWKRIDFLLQLVAELSAEYQLVILGDGMESERLREQARQLGIVDRVRFEGRAPRKIVQEWALAADAFLLPSLYEGFPHVAVEAACSGLPCFLSDKGGNPEAARLYADRIQVLPYENLVAWKQALEVLPPRPAPQEPPPFSEVARAYLEAITSRL